MNRQLWDGFIAVTKQEVIPALGCTEPVSVALAAAIAMQRLGGQVKTVRALVSPNLMKNGMGVGIPGTGRVGLPIAAAIGAIAGDPHAGLEVLQGITSTQVEQAARLVEAQAVQVEIADTEQIIYAKVTVDNGGDFVTVTIANSHTNVVSIEENGIAIKLPTATYCPDRVTSDSSNTSPFVDATAEDIYQFSVHVPLQQIAFIEQAGTLNSALSKEGLTADYGLQIGKTFQRNVERGLLSGGLLTEVLMRTSAASDARMDGAMIAAMSNSGSGNQGIAATMPIVATAEFLQASHEQTTRALMLANLMAIYIKRKQHKLSALCGATTAAMGSVAGITWLLGGNYQQISYAISNMIGDIAGVICDGAKTGCAMKVSSSAGAAVKAALMAIDNVYVTGNEGIVATDVEGSIANLSALANGAMTQTDAQILDIMVNKAF